ncbi:hypothetical protein ACIP10_13280 [Streptomyces galbus]
MPVIDRLDDDVDLTVLLRPDPAALDPWFLAGFLDGSVAPD